MSPKIEKFLVWAIKIGFLLTILTPLILSKYTLFPALYGKSVYFRLVIEITAFLYVALLLLTLDRKYLPSKSPLLFVVIIYTGVLVLATITSINPARSFWGSIERMEGLIAYVHFLAFFIMLTGVLKERKDWLFFLKCLVSASLVFAAAAFIQMAKINFFYASPTDVRLTSTFGNPIFYAEYLVFIIFLSVFLSLIEAKKETKIALWLICLLNLFLLLNTGTRSAWIGFGIGAVFLLAIWFIFYGRENVKIRKYLIFLLLFIVLAFLIFILLSQKGILPDTVFYARYSALWGALFNLKNSRTVVWLLGLRAWLAAPIIGHGLESFSYLYDTHYRSDMLSFISENIFFDRSHNKLIDALATTGILGLVSYLSIFVAAAWLIIKRRNGWLNGFPPLILVGLLIAYLAQNFFGFDVITSYAIFYIILAFIVVNFPAPAVEPEQKLNRTGFFSLRMLAIFFAAVFTVYAVYAVNVYNVRANLDIIKFYEILSGQGQGDPLAYLEKSYNTPCFTKYEMRYYGAEALLKILNNNPSNAVFNKGAIKKLKETADYLENYLDGNKEILQERSYLLMSQVYKIIYLLERDNADLRQAEKFLQKASALNPNFIQIYRFWGEIKFLKGDQKAGETFLKKAYQMDNNRAAFYEWMGISLAESGEKQKGAEMMRKKIDLGDFFSPGNFDLNFVARLAQLYEENKNYKDLAGLYKETIEKYPNNNPPVQIYVNLAVAYYKLGDKANFKKSLFSLATKYPEYAQKAAQFQIDVEKNPDLIK